MSSSFNHIFIPLVLLVLFFRTDARKALALSFFAVLPDMDIIFLPHRAALHNIFILIIPMLLLIFVKSRRDIFAIICFYLASHLVLDIFNGGIFPLYPVYDKVFFTHLDLSFNHNSLVPALQYGISNKIVNMGRGESVVSSENFGVAVLLMAIAVISYIHKHRFSQTV